MRTLVLGGYGNFGARICRALAADPTLELRVGGRDAARALALAEQLGHGAQALPIDLTAPDLASRLRAAGIGLVIHTAGPFQGQDYRVARAAAEAGAHCIDLADGRRFVCDFAAALDAPFRAAGRVAVSGASSLPALSSAVVDDLCAGWTRIDSIDICIAPAQTAPRGRATLEGVLACCGEWVDVWCDGRWQPRRGWAGGEWVSFARMRPRRAALCDVPDLALFPAHYRVAQRVMFRAAIEVPLAQRALAWLSAWRAAGLIGPPARWAGWLNAGAGLLDGLGSATGGMVVRVDGLDGQDRPRRRAWHLTAPDDHGPEIPCMAAILLARRLARGQGPDPGARAAVGLLALAEFAPEFAHWSMATDTLDETPDIHHAAPAP